MKLLLLPGDGIGPEISAATQMVIEAADRSFGLGLRLEQADIGLVSLAACGSTLPADLLDRARASDGIVLGPVSHYQYPPRSEGGLNPSAELRVGLDLYANIRPSRSRPGIGILREPMDLVIVRENTEGFYADRNMHAGSGEFMPNPDTALAVRHISARASRRIAETAFALAAGRRGKVTAVHKANVLKMTDGLFLREVRAVAAGYPNVGLDEVIVDAAAALLIRSPARFDVIVTTNMFGDILSDEASELSGGLGLGGSINAGDSLCMAQAQHGSAPDIAGRGIANPTSLILSAAMMFEWLGRRHGRHDLVSAAAAVDAAVDRVLAVPAARTPDLGGNATTSGFAQAVCESLRSEDGQALRR